MAGATGLPPADHLRRAREVKEDDVGTVSTQLFAVPALQRRTAHHAALAAMAAQPHTDSVEPRVSVVVVERLSRRHLLDVGRRRKVIGVAERPPQPLTQCGAHRRFTGPGYAHDDDR